MPLAGYSVLFLLKSYWEFDFSESADRCNDNDHGTTGVCLLDLPWITNDYSLFSVVRLQEARRVYCNSSVAYNKEIRKFGNKRENGKHSTSRITSGSQKNQNRYRKTTK